MKNMLGKFGITICGCLNAACLVRNLPGGDTANIVVGLLSLIGFFASTMWAMKKED